MKKNDIVKAVSFQTGIKEADVKEVFDVALTAIINGVLKGEKVSINGFGVFYSRLRKSKVGTVGMRSGNPQRVELPKKNLFSFKGSEEVNKVLN